MYLEPQFLTVGIGILIGAISLMLLPKGEPQVKDKKFDPPVQKSKEKSEIKQNEEVRNRFSQPSKKIDQIKPLRDDIQNIIETEEGFNKKKKEISERREKILKNLTANEREQVEQYFTAKAKEITDGTISQEERRFRLVLQILSYGIFIVFILMLYVILAIGLGTTDPQEMLKQAQLIILKIAQP